MASAHGTSGANVMLLSGGMGDGKAFREASCPCPPFQHSSPTTKLYQNQGGRGEQTMPVTHLHVLPPRVQKVSILSNNFPQLQPKAGSYCCKCGCPRADVRLTCCNSVVHGRCVYPWPVTRCPSCSMDGKEMAFEVLLPEPYTRNGATLSLSHQELSKKRGGRWSEAECAFAELVMEGFGSGMLPLRDGSRLGTFLCSLLQCTSARLSSKLRTGKRNFRYLVDEGISAESIFRYEQEQRQLSRREELFLHYLSPEEAALASRSLQLEWRLQFLHLGKQVGVRVSNLYEWDAFLKTVVPAAPKAVGGAGGPQALSGRKPEGNAEDDTTSPPTFSRKRRTIGPTVAQCPDNHLQRVRGARQASAEQDGALPPSSLATRGLGVLMLRLAADKHRNFTVQNGVMAATSIEDLLLLLRQGPGDECSVLARAGNGAVLFVSVGIKGLLGWGDADLVGTPLIDAKSRGGCATGSGFQGRLGRNQNGVIHGEDGSVLQAAVRQSQVHTASVLERLGNPQLPVQEHDLMMVPLVLRLYRRDRTLVRRQLTVFATEDFLLLHGSLAAPTPPVHRAQGRRRENVHRPTKQCGYQEGFYLSQHEGQHTDDYQPYQQQQQQQYHEEHQGQQEKQEPQGPQQWRHPHDVGHVETRQGKERNDFSGHLSKSSLTLSLRNLALAPSHQYPRVYRNTSFTSTLPLCRASVERMQASSLSTNYVQPAHLSYEQVVHEEGGALPLPESIIGSRGPQAHSITTSEHESSVPIAEGGHDMNSCILHGAALLGRRSEVAPTLVLESNMDVEARVEGAIERLEKWGSQLSEEGYNIATSADDTIVPRKGESGLAEAEVIEWATDEDVRLALGEHAREPTPQMQRDACGGAYDLCYSPPSTFEETMRAFLLGLPAQCFQSADIWVPFRDPRTKRLSLQFGSGLALRGDLSQWIYYSRNFAFFEGQGMPGRVFRSQVPEYLENIASIDAKLFLRRDGAQVAGVHSSFGVPLVQDDSVIVLVFYSNHDSSSHITQELLDFVRRATASWKIQTTFPVPKALTADPDHQPAVVRSALLR